MIEYGKGQSALRAIPQDERWKDKLRTDRNGNYQGDEANVLAALRHAPALKGAARFNQFSNKVEIGREVHWRDATVGEEWTDADDLDVMAWLQEQDIPIRARNAIGEAVQRVARDNAYHPVRDYLNGLEWDGEPRLDHWLADYLSADADSAYLAAVGRAFMVSAVARIYEPGCQADHVLVLEGGQGVGKSRTMQTLGHPWTTDSIPDLHSKDAALQLAGVWLVELAELAALRRSEVEPTKAFITRRVDRYRPPYGKRAIDVPRQCVFIATTNESAYLRDRTGNRRFWPVRANYVELDALAQVRGQLWAEAVHLYRHGEPWHLTGERANAAEREQQRREYRTELEQHVADYLGRLEAKGVSEVTTTDVFRHALGLELPKDMEKARRLGPEMVAAMGDLGWRRVGEKGRYPNRRVLYAKQSRNSRRKANG
ncbi:VapE domain-containing protein [Lentisalinibacter sediminis]|uniref:VapE domain-containing protein n=1 Tax=Lentisalinibacter sediminis TaxID=2992237 RepID=UPI00386E993C